MTNRIIEIKERLMPENEAVLARFAQDGVDLSAEKEVAFFIEMPSKQDVLSSADEMRKNFPRKAYHGTIHHKDPIVTYYRYDIFVSLTAEAISQIEAELLSVCEKHGGGPSFWEFAG